MKRPFFDPYSPREWAMLAMFCAVPFTLGVLDSAFWASPVTLPWLLTLLCLGGLMVLFLGVTWRVIRWHGAQFQRRIRNQCQSCGYDLRATPDRCPECGTVAGTVRRVRPNRE